jgi:hypothetical protein
VTVPPRYVVSWLAVAAVATAVGVGTVVVVRSTVGADTVVTSLSQAEVQAQLSAATATPATVGVSPTASVRPSSQTTATSPGGQMSHPATSGATTAPSGGTHRPSGPATSGPGPTSTSAHGPSPSGAATVTGVLASPGGTVVAQCTAGSVYLVSWSPAQGYAVHEVSRGGPGSHEAEITFVRAAGGEVHVHVTCGRDGPVQQVETGD